MARGLHAVGRFCARWAGWVIVAWVLLAVCLALAIQVFGADTSNDLSLPGTGSQQATDVLTERFPPQQNGSNPIVFAVDEGTLTDAEHKAAVQRAIKDLRAAPHVYSVLNPISSKGQTAGLLSDDKRIAFAPVLLDISAGELDEDVATRVFDAAQRPAAAAGIDVEAAGSIGSTLSTPATESSEIVGIVAAMVILTLVLGSLVAMGLPILTAIIGLSAALSTIGLVGHLFGIPSIAPTIATMIGLGVGIDYALFLVSRHQSQLAEGMATKDSVATSVATAGSAIAFAGGTVIIALLSLAVAGIPLVTSMGIAAAIAVVTAVSAALTLLPALLSLVDHRISALAIPGFLHHESKTPGRFWRGWSLWVTGHPGWAVLAALAILVPLIVPAFSLRLGQEDIGATPLSTTERRAYDLITDGFGVGFNGPLLIASVLDPAAQPSKEYEKKYDRATGLQKSLTKEQKSLERQQRELERQQAELEEQQRALTADADALRVQQAALLAQEQQLRAEETALEDESAELMTQQTQLEREKSQLERAAEALATQAKRTATALALNRARENLVEDRIANTSNPVRLDRLQARLERIEVRQDRLLSRVGELEREAEQLARQAERLRRQAERLQTSADQLKAESRALQVQASELTEEAAALQAESAGLEAAGADLQRQADALTQQGDELQAEANKAKKQKKTANRLKRELTAELTRAGGDDRATDPRVVRLQTTLLATPGITALLPPQLSDQGDALVLNAVPTTAPSSPQTAELVMTLRNTVLPGIETGGITDYVGGVTAANVDLAAKIADRLPLVILTVLVLSYLLLLLAFRSFVIPLQAALTNLLSVTASFGVLTAVFQWGWGLSLVGLDPGLGSVPIASYVPLMMFAVLFGLSMDYEVFFVSQAVAHRTGSSDEVTPLREGLASSARVISAAALIMMCVFGSFILNGDPTVKQFGVGLSVAVALAALLVLLLAPAVLTIFGRVTWWLPHRVDRMLPNLGIEE